MFGFFIKIYLHFAAFWRVIFFDHKVRNSLNFFSLETKIWWV